MLSDLVLAISSYPSGKCVDIFLNIFQRSVGFIRFIGNLPCNIDSTALMKSLTCWIICNIASSNCLTAVNNSICL